MLLLLRRLRCFYSPVVLLEEEGEPRWQFIITIRRCRVRMRD